jgi:hypothetical protein
VLAFAAVPLIISSCKPVAKKIGEKLAEWGEKLKKENEEVPAPPVQEEQSSNATVKEKDVSAETVKTASPPGKEEVKEQVASQQAKTKAPPKAKPAAKKKAAPKAKPGTATNPKKSG